MPYFKFKTQFLCDCLAWTLLTWANWMPCSLHNFYSVQSVKHVNEMPFLPNFQVNQLLIKS